MLGNIDHELTGFISEELLADFPDFFERTDLLDIFPNDDNLFTTLPISCKKRLQFQVPHL